MTPLPGAQPPRGAGGSRRAQGTALSTRATNGAPAGEKRAQGSPGGENLGSSSPEQRERELADPYPSLNKMQARALLGNGKASLAGSVITPQQVRRRAPSTGPRRGATPRIGADWPEEEEDGDDDDDAEEAEEGEEEEEGDDGEGEGGEEEEDADSRMDDSA